MDTIDTKTLRELARADSLQSVRAIADEDGFQLLLRYGNAERLLEAAKGHVRRFRALDSVASYLKTVGVFDFQVDTKNWRSHMPKNGEANE